MKKFIAPFIFVLLLSGCGNWATSEQVEAGWAEQAEKLDLKEAAKPSIEIKDDIIIFEIDDPYLNQDPYRADSYTLNPETENFWTCEYSETAYEWDVISGGECGLGVATLNLAEPPKFIVGPDLTETGPDTGTFKVNAQYSEQVDLINKDEIKVLYFVPEERPINIKMVVDQESDNNYIIKVEDPALNKDPATLEKYLLTPATEMTSYQWYVESGEGFPSSSIYINRAEGAKFLLGNEFWETEADSGIFSAKVQVTASPEGVEEPIFSPVYIMVPDTQPALDFDGVVNIPAGETQEFELKMDITEPEEETAEGIMSQIISDDSNTGEPRLVDIYDYMDVKTMTSYAFPFPERQFTTDDPHDFLSGPAGYCANTHYHAVKGKALTIDLQWMYEPLPEYGCGFPMIDIGLRQQTMTAEEIAAWEAEFNK